jgi:pSer/pThr/pTyr-binding forkhead associated (FHA) protein
LASLVSRDGRRYELQTGRATTIGRSADNDIVLEHRSVSRRHTIIQETDRRFSIRDLNSSNGTWVHGRRISAAQLGDGDVLRCGEVELTFHHVVGEKESGVARPRLRAYGRTPRMRLVVTSTAATALFTFAAFGITRFILNHPSSIRRLPTEGFSRINTPAVEQTGITAAELHNAVLEMDKSHGADSSWVSNEANLDMCKRKALRSDSSFCRVAYLSSDMRADDGAERLIPFEDIVQFCDSGALDKTSRICERAHSAPSVNGKE